MTTSQLCDVSVATQASVYFDGRCISHQITCADGSKKSVGVILPATLTFHTAAPEAMECVAGGCAYRLAGDAVWREARAGDSFSVPAQSSFDIRVTEAYHYICHFG